MSGLQFVNLRGEPVALHAEKAKARAGRTPEAYHKGWVVVGHAPDQVADARRLYEEEAAAARAKGIDRPPFDPVANMRAVKTRPVRSKPYELHDAATQCAELARRTGWSSVTVVPKAKGVR